MHFCSILLQGCKGKVKSIFVVLSLMLFILVLPLTAQSQGAVIDLGLKLHSKEPSNSSIYLAPKTEQKFKVTASITPGGPEIKSIEFYAKGAKGLDKRKKGTFWRLDPVYSLTFEVKYEWSKVGTYSVEVKAVATNGESVTHNWIVIVKPPFDLTDEELEDLLNPPADINITKAEAVQRFWRGFIPYTLVLDVDNEVRIEVGESVNFVLEAESEDDIKYIEFSNSGDPNPSILDAFLNKDSCIIGCKKHSHNRSYTFNNVGDYKVSGTVKTEKNTEQVTWTVKVVPANQNQKPIRTDTIEAQSLTVGTSSSPLDVSNYFSDPNMGDILTYEVRSDNTDVATIQKSGSQITIQALKSGTATITVTATDPDGLSASLYITVRVREQASYQAPVPVGTIPTQSLTVGISSSPLDVSNYFSDPDGDTLTYEVRSDNTDVAITQKLGSQLTIWALKSGTATITVTATDPNGLSASLSFAVMVNEKETPKPPLPKDSIPSQSLPEDGSGTTVNVAQYFSSSNSLTYEAEVNPSGIANASVSGSRVTITPVSAGVTTVVVTARDTVTNLTAIQTISVVVYQTSAVIVRPPTNTDPTFTPPDSNPRAEGLREGVSVIVDGLATGNTLKVREEPGTGKNDVIELLGNGVTGIVTEGPKDVGIYRWWKIDWDRANIEGWSAEVVDDVQLLFRRPPDLEIRDFDVSKSQVSIGERIELEVEIRNNGPGESAATEVYFYYHSGSKNYDLDDLSRETDLRIPGTGKLSVPSLRERRSRTLTLRVDAPSVPDRYYYGAFLPSNVHDTDNTDHLTSRMISNNLASEQRVTVNGRPDYIVESISVSKTTLDPGGSFTLTATVRNQGLGAPTSSPDLDYYRSTDARISSRDRWVDNDRVSKLDRNETGRESVSLTAPTEPGVYYYGACVSDVRNESNTSNNCSAAVAITVRPATTPVITGSPDLVVSLSSTSNNSLVDPNENVMLSATVRNQGAADAPSSTTLRYYLSTDAAISSDDQQIGTDSVRSLRNGNSDAEDLRIRAPSQPGTYYYYACVNSVTGEEWTDNNCSNILTINVRGSDLIVDSVSVDLLGQTGGINPNGSFRLNATIKNQGTGDAATTTVRYYISADQTLSTDDSEVHIASISAINSGASINVQSTIIRFPWTSGVFYCFVCVDGLTNEIDTENNCSVPIPITVLNVAPVIKGTIVVEETLQAGTPFNIDVSPYFTDRNNDTLTYSANSSDDNIATASVSDAQVIITPKRAGTATITVTARDNEFTATQMFTITVTAIISEADWMPDANLRATIKKVLGLTSRDILTQEAMQSLTHLDAGLPFAPGEPGEAVGLIKDITGLEYATQLTDLGLTLHGLSDISALSGLTQLTKLDLSFNRIHDLTPLKNLTKLSILYLYDNKISDVTPLEELIALNRLYLDNILGTDADGNNIMDYRPLHRLKQKNPGIYIDIDIGDIPDVSVEPDVPDFTNQPEEVWMPDVNLRVVVRNALALQDNEALTQEAMQRLKHLEVDVPPEPGPYNRINELTGLEYSTQLIELSLSGHGFSDISALSDLTQLTHLDLSFTGVKDISALSDLTQLTHLDLSFTEVKDINALSGLTQLTHLFLSWQGLVDIGPLQNLRELDYLILDNNKISNISPLENLTALTRIELSYNQIKDLTPLENLTNLTRIGLRENQISDITPLKDLTSLESLNLWNNQISDITPLKDLKNLWLLLLSNNQITDVSPLEGLTGLRRLDLEGNRIEDLAPLRRLKAKNPSVQIDIVIPEETEEPVETVTNSAPIAVGTVPSLTMSEGDPDQSVKISDYFSDPDGDTLGYSQPTSSDTSIATATIGLVIGQAGTWVYITPVGAGSATITVTASDGVFSTNQTVSVTVSASPEPTISEEEWMPDANLRATVRNILGLAADQPLTQQAMQRVTHLTARSSEISDISGLKYATKLQVLDLYDNQISDISPLADLTTLTWLQLQSNQISDISPLADLTALTLLFIGVNQISDISPLENMRELTRASLAKNQIKDISPLKNLTALTGIYLNRNQISDISPLAGLTELTGLSLWNNQISDIKPLENLTKLTDLALSENQISDISHLENLIELTILHLTDNQISDISPLAGLTKLTILNLWNNQISDVTSLENLTALNSLTLSGNPITDYVPLRRLKTKNPNLFIDIDIGAAPAALTIPNQTVLLPNYPNPFNPETWIPYQLAKPAEVTLTIYNVRGVVVRQLTLGHRPAGVYYSQNRAAHWDGRNNIGEKVATGLYFVKFTAGDYTATRKMLIRK